MRKTTASGRLDFLYDKDGNKVAEVDSTGVFQRGELYAGGRHFAVYAPDPGPSGATFFIHADWLGTERARTNMTGAACETTTSLPFGDGQTIGDTCGDSAGDVSPLHFTGKERDTESGLDNFGARYDSSSLGRFMSPDPLMASATVYDPQTWNRYTYTLNNPLRFIDPDGMVEVSAEACEKDRKCVTLKLNVIYDANANNGKGLTDKQKEQFEKSELQKAKDEYGSSNIHLDVTYSSGTVGPNGQTTGSVEGALNVWVSDHSYSGYASDSGRLEGGGFGIMINVNRSNGDLLSHELAHNIFGDTSGLAYRMIMAATSKDAALGSMLKVGYNALIADPANGAARTAAGDKAMFLMRDEFIVNARADMNRSARSFSNILTQQAAIRPRQQ